MHYNINILIFNNLKKLTLARIVNSLVEDIFCRLDFIKNP